jgi:hypothetical protein
MEADLLLTVDMEADLLTVDMEADSFADGGRDIVVGNAEERPHLMPPHVHKGQLASCRSGPQVCLLNFIWRYTVKKGWPGCH